MRCVAGGLLAAVVALAAPSLSAETCTCANESFAWTGLATTLPPSSWDGCSPSVGDDYEPGIGCHVHIPGGSVVELGVGPGQLTLRDDSRLEVQAGAELVVSGEGIRVRDTATLAIQGRALETGSSPGFDALQLGPSTLVELGEYIPCPGSDPPGGVPSADCDGGEGGSTAEAAICWPDAQFDAAPGSTTNFAGYVAQVQPGDVVVFWDYTGGFDPSRDVNAMYEVVDVQYASSTHRCLVLNLEQGDSDQVWSGGPGRGYPLSRRRIKPVAVRGAQAAGDVVVETYETDLDDADAFGRTPDYHARWLGCRGPQGELDRHAKILQTVDDAAGDRIELMPGGIDIALADGEECFVDYGWQSGDTLAVFRPGRISAPDGVLGALVETDQGAETIDFDFALLDQLGEIDLNATTHMDWVWVRDITTGLAALELSGPAMLRGFQMTGGPAQCGCHHTILLDAHEDGDLDGTRIEDCNLRHSGDDFVVLSGDSGGSGGSIDDVEIRRCRFAFADGRGASDNVIDQGTAGSASRSLRLRGFLMEDAGANGSASFQGSSPGLMSVRDGALISQYGGSFAAGTTEPWSFRNVYDAKHVVPGSNGVSFLRAAAGGFREMTFRATEFQPGGGASFTRTDAQALSDLDRLLIVSPSMGSAISVFQHSNLQLDQEWTDVAIVDAQTDNTSFVDRSVVHTGGGSSEVYDMRMQRWTLAWPAGATTGFREGIHLSGNNAVYDTLRHYEGFVIAGLYSDAGTTGAVGGTGGDYNALSGLCLFDNEVDAEQPGSLPSGTLSGMELRFEDEGAGDYRLSPGSPGFGVCGARNAGVRPDNWALRVLHYDAAANGDSWRSPGFPGGGDWCGDLDADQLVSASDVQALREHLSGQAPLDTTGSLRCDVFDEERPPGFEPDPGDLAGGCSIADVSVMIRQLAGLGPWVQSLCAAGSRSACCAPHGSPGCGHPETVACVCAALPSCCTGVWDASCAALACTGACADSCGDAVIGPTEDCEAPGDCDAGDVCDSSCSCRYLVGS